MAEDRYIINFTDQKTDRKFVITPFTTNGPTNPTSGTLDLRATSAATSLRLVGKGLPEYGDIVLENLVHLMEHFAGETEPAYPTNGQLWYNRSVIPDQLCVYNAFKHHLLPSVTTPANIAWYSIDGDHKDRLETLGKLRITQKTTGLQEEYILSNISVVYVAGLPKTDFRFVSPPSTTRGSNGWYIGGWEYVIQNNTPLREDFNAGGFKIINLAPPTNDNDVATKQWVIDQITAGSLGSAELDDLTDVMITDPVSVNQILMHNGSFWVNAAASSMFVSSTGGTMTGYLTLHADPVSNYHAVTKQYVDNLFGAIELDDLTDVTISGTPLDDSVLLYSSSQWRNVSLSSFVATGNFLLTTGGTVTGPIYYNGTPVANNEFITKQYVDSYMGDGVVTGGTYDLGTNKIILTRSNSLSNIEIELSGLSGGGGGSSTTITHTIDNPNDPTKFATIPDGSMLQTKYAATTSVVALNEIIKEISTELGQWQAPRRRFVFTTDGDSTVYLGDTSGGAQPNQCNPIGSLNVGYVVGSENLQVYVNGQKYVASEYGYRKIGATQKFFTSRAESSGNVFIVDGNYAAYFLSGGVFNVDDGVNIGSFTSNADATYDSGANETTIPVSTAVSNAGSGVITKPNTKFGLWQGTRTGLGSGTTYSFRVSVNGGANTIIGVPGASAQTVGAMINYINTQSDLNTWGFGTKVWGGDLYFYSNTPGTGSSIAITDGDGGSGTPLFSNLNGGTTSTGAFVVSLPGTTNPYAPGSFGYDEYGRVGTISNRFTFTTTPPLSGSVVEVIIDREVY